MQEYRYCPKCYGPMMEPRTALSRRDRTKICSDCGLREAAEDLGVKPEDYVAFRKMIQNAIAKYHRRNKPEAGG